jgi:NADH dehydrogenase/NADH:ubiquinone oxidoreductase subunit G
MHRASINHIRRELPEGRSILDALRAIGQRLPTLCHDDRVAPSGACRLCRVHVAGLAKPVTACTTPLRDGMDIETDTPDLREAAVDSWRCSCVAIPPMPSAVFPIRCSIAP